MIPGKFSYEVHLNVTFDGRDLLALFNGGRGHYDAKCRAAALPGDGKSGGQIWGVLNQWTLPGEYVAGETSENMFLRLLQEFPDRTVQVCLPFRTLDLFCKCVETHGTLLTEGDRARADVAIRLKHGLGIALREINDETRRVNPVVPEPL